MKNEEAKNLTLKPKRPKLSEKVEERESIRMLRFLKSFLTNFRIMTLPWKM